ncbi:MAG: glycosyltransferase family 4 protein [Ardenticatenales bacterium]|nr:glycosyltransferase family 4 protein [Ardenticatenales bacterium]
MAISARRIAQGLAAAGHQLHLCYPQPQLAPGEWQTIQDGDLLCHPFGPQRRPDDALMEWFEWIVALHQQYKFDILHGHYLVGAGWVTVYAGRYLGIPTVVSPRGNDLERTVFAPAEAAPILYALSWADGVAAVSQDLARKAQALAGGRLVSVIHNGVNADLFQPGPPAPDLRAELGLKPDAPLLGFVGEARQKKGLSELLLAQAELTARAPGTPPALLLIGDVRPKDKEILSLFRKQNPGVKVRRLPYVLEPERLVTLYNSLDLLLLPSRRDGLPNSLLEGMACARPVLATAVGGIPDALEDGVSGVLLPPRDVAALVNAITALLADPERRAELGQAARARVLADFRPEQEIAGYLALYARLLG